MIDKNRSSYALTLQSDRPKLFYIYIYVCVCVLRHKFMGGGGGA